MLRNDSELTRRLLLTLTALLWLPAAALAQDWPPKSVRIVVPFAPGSTPDMVGRVLADSLQARHPGSSFVVENKPGASGNIGTDAVAAARWPSTRCCSPNCPTIPILTSRRSRS
jgi:tripartite-type tricarboxylate transporter receptor subunit TctC